MRFRLVLVWLLLATASWALDFSRVLVEPVKTSIYLGYVQLQVSELRREGDRYVGTYKARVVPLFFASEEGDFYVECTDAQLAALQRGERVNFHGGGRNSDGEERRVEGHVTAEAVDAPGGKIKVRIFVSKKIQLIFNTSYRFAP